MSNVKENIDQVKETIDKIIVEVKKWHGGLLLGLVIGFMVFGVLEGLEKSLWRVILFFELSQFALLTVLFFKWKSTEKKAKKDKVKKKK